MGLMKKTKTADVSRTAGTARRDPALPGSCGYGSAAGYHHRLPSDTHPWGMTFVRPDGQPNH